ncbi:hypothetical protein KR018_002385 [Drosophila ironensis]|nr:hypothetical protein KR018_002385 [Drosophila ironensis]
MRDQQLAALVMIVCIAHACRSGPVVAAQGMPVSPCPKIFQYRFDGAEWFGLMAIHSPDARQPLHLRLTLSMRGKPTTVSDTFCSNYLGEIELLTRGQFSSNAPVLYKIRFPKHHFPPKVLLASANNQVICFGTPDHSIFMTQIQLEHIRKLTFIPDKKSSLLDMDTAGEGPKKMAPAEASQTQFKKKLFAHQPKNMCGRINRGFEFRKESDSDSRPETLQQRSSDSSISSPVFADIDDDDFDDELDHEEGEADGSVGTDTLPSITRGSWPWLAAIYVNNLTSLDFQCGGTLVSGRAVISSAHCFKLFNNRYTANEVLVFLGRHNLKNWNEEGSLAAPVDGIYIHPDYNSQLSSYDADIAVIMLKKAVRFNAFIRPACLWSGSSKTDYIVGEQGIVIGWSFDKLQNATQPHGPPSGGGGSGKKSLDTSTPKMVKAPIFGNTDCFRANVHFRSLSSNRTFCAGIQLDMPQPGDLELYTGISGAGLLIFRNNRWMLRGTVSAALPADKVTETDADADATAGHRRQLMIYADVAKFLDWITAFII